jgi:NTP pyrophosphatase (non-canonical NTP hydrolase)
MSCNVWIEAAEERARAHRIHRDHSMESAPATSERRLRILFEEVGEVAKEFNDAEVEARPIDTAKLRKELIQVCAMAGAWADVIET